MQILRNIALTGLIAVSTSQVFIAPATAANKQFNYKVEYRNQESFADMVKRAEIKTENAIRREFSRRSGTNQLSIRITGERNGQQAPIMMVSITRSQWRNRPKIKSWGRYYSDSSKLLGFTNTSQATTPQANQPSTPTK